jgi:hypothetical protein
MKAAWMQHYVMFPTPISFLDHELKAELGIKAKKEKGGETSDNYFSLKSPLTTLTSESVTDFVNIPGWSW